MSATQTMRAAIASLDRKLIDVAAKTAEPNHLDAHARWRAQMNATTARFVHATRRARRRTK